MRKVLFELSGDEKKLLMAYRKAKAEQDELMKGAEKGIVATKPAVDRGFGP